MYVVSLMDIIACKGPIVFYLYLVKIANPGMLSHW